MFIQEFIKMMIINIRVGPFSPEKTDWSISRRDSMILVFRMGRHPADADSVISIEYFSELLNHVSNIRNS